MALPNWQRNIVDETGNVIPGAQVEVRRESDNALADLFSDRDGDTALANPFTADSTGFVEFYASAGEYKVEATSTGGTRTWRYEVLSGTAAVMDNQTGDDTLRTAASRDVTESATDNSSGKVLTPESYGIGKTVAYTGSLNDIKTTLKVLAASVATDKPTTSDNYIVKTIGARDVTSQVRQIAYKFGDPDTYHRHFNFGSDFWTPWRELYHTGNTTVDGNGFIKEASPIIRLFGTGETEEPCQETGATVKRKSTGHYEITGTLGFAKKGWYIETPKDANGSIKVLTEYEQSDDNTITVKTYEPTGTGWRPEKGGPIDIPDGRWIDIRLEAPDPEPEPEEAEA